MLSISPSPDWHSLPVWRCQDLNTCGEQWATLDEGTTCPFCHNSIGQNTGFTCGEVQIAMDKYGFTGEFPVHVPQPVPELVQLSLISQDAWVGLPVFHPCGQEGNLANWLLYDVGVVVAVIPNQDFPCDLQCQLLASSGGGSFLLTYSPSNLWVPRVLADRL